MIFETRYKAWEYLSTFIRNKIHDLSNTVIVWILKWWLPVTYQVSQDLNIPSTFVVVKKLIYNNTTFWVISQWWTKLYNKTIIAKLGLSEHDVKDIEKQTYEEAKYEKEKYWLFYNDFQWKQVIVIDDGIYTWFSAVAAAKQLKEQWASRLILAIPVSNNKILSKLQTFYDEIVCVEPIEDRNFALSKYYMSYYKLIWEDVNELFYKLKEKELFLK